jgi:hypothetical protein
MFYKYSGIEKDKMSIINNYIFTKGSGGADLRWVLPGDPYQERFPS